MGIDAKILIRGVKHSTVTDEWLKRVSWDLVAAFDHRKFWIQDGIPPAEHRKLEEAWHKAFDAHPFAQRYRDAEDVETRRALHKHILEEIGECPKELRLAVQRCNEMYPDEEGNPPGSVYYQDGDDVRADDGECLLELSLWGRYYGVGYERGDIRFYVGVAEWLEQNIPGCSVWYGGDSSGVEVELFDKAARDLLIQHANSPKGNDYYKRSWLEDRDSIPKPPPCGMCPGGVYGGNRYGFGKDFASYSCMGCGKSVETRDGGKTWQEKKDKF